MYLIILRLSNIHCSSTSEHMFKICIPDLTLQLWQCQKFHNFCNRGSS